MKIDYYFKVSHMRINNNGKDITISKRYFKDYDKAGEEFDKVNLKCEMDEYVKFEWVKRVKNYYKPLTDEEVEIDAEIWYSSKRY